MKIASAVFDLDGTLMKSDATIYKCTQHTLRHFNIPGVMPEEEFNNKIGYHFKDIFEGFNISVPDLENFIAKYKTFYFDFIDESRIFPNVLETLGYLNKKGIKVSLLTTKAQDQAEKILGHFGMSEYFEQIVGRRPDMNIKPAPDALLYICEKTGVTAENTLMVGDSELDIRCGKNAGAHTCAVTFGYRKLSDLLKENPDIIINDMKELTKYI